MGILPFARSHAKAGPGATHGEKTRAVWRLLHRIGRFAALANASRNSSL
jgi:hypothetical protein